MACRSKIWFPLKTQEQSEEKETLVHYIEQKICLYSLLSRANKFQEKKLLAFKLGNNSQDPLDCSGYEHVPKLS